MNGKNQRLLRASSMLLTLVVLTSVMTPRLAQASEALRYTVHVNAALESMLVEVSCDACDALPPLWPLSRNAVDVLDTKALSGLKLANSMLSIASARKKASYAVSLTSDRRSAGLDGLTGTKLRMTDPRDWLWVPKNWALHRPIEVVFRLPSEVSVATPWPHAVAGRDHYRVAPVLPTERGAVVFGTMEQSVLRIDRSIIQVSIIGAESRRAQEYHNWITNSAQSAAHTFGRFPLPLTQIVVVPLKWGDGPVPFGHIVRGTGTTMILYVSQSASAVALHENWTLTHEMTHLAHPFLGAEGRWLAEGLAGYYQNAIRAQSGALSPRVASANLLRSFKATAAEHDKGPLDDAGRMRTYWTAAVMALDIDLQLRATPSKLKTLAQVMGAFSKLHLPSKAQWNPDAYMRELDALAGTALIYETYQRYAQGQQFPAFETLTVEAETLFEAWLGDIPQAHSVP